MTLARATRPEIEMKYERMLPHEIDQVLAERPIAILPWGALEWHGYHQAIGLDGLKASAIADRVAERIGAVSLPPVYCGYQSMKPHAGFGYTIEVSQPTVAALVRDFVSQLADEGFKVVVIIAGHYGPRHVDTLRFNADQMAEEVGVKVWTLPEYEVVTDLGYLGDHAGKWETSILWQLYPDLVQIDRYRKDLSGKDQGVSGREDPSEHASPELGREILDAIVEQIATRVLGLLDEARSEGVSYRPWRPVGRR